MTDYLHQRVHVSVQIEGTTDSSFLNELGDIYGAERVMVYQLTTKKFIRLSDISAGPAQTLLKMGKDLLGTTPLFNQATPEHGDDGGPSYSRKELPPDTAAVHGLFTPSLFKGIFDNPFVSIILKDPLERMIALYEEWQAAKGEVEWRVRVPYQKKMTFVEFAVRDGFPNFQSKCLGSRRLGDFDLVGLAECQEGFIAQLKNRDWTGFVNQKNLEIQLENPKYKYLALTREFLDEFKEINQIDYAIYQQAKEFIGYCR